MSSLKRIVANTALRGLHVLHATPVQAFTRDVLDEVDLDHLRRTYNGRHFINREFMFQHLRVHVLNNEPIDYLEFGVYEGESIAHWSREMTHPDCRFFGFDSFQGLPEDWRPGQPKGHFAVHGTPYTKDPRVTWVKGWFDTTVPEFCKTFAPKNRLVVHLDADLYSSTMVALVHLTPFMRDGTVLMFDEFYDRQHEFKAFADWQRIFRKQYAWIGEVGQLGKVCLQVTGA